MENLRHGPPMKVSGWLYVRSRSWTRKRQCYAKLLGEVLTFGPNEHAPATEEYGVRGCRVEVGFRRNAFVVTLSRDADTPGVDRLLEGPSVDVPPGRLSREAPLRLSR